MSDARTEVPRRMGPIELHLRAEIAAVLELVGAFPHTEAGAYMAREELSRVRTLIRAESSSLQMERWQIEQEELQERLAQAAASELRPFTIRRR